MIYSIETVTFPHAGVLGTAARNRDGSFSLYISNSLSEPERKQAIAELTGRIRKKV